MNLSFSFRTLVRTYGLWAALLAIPLIVNGLVWRLVVVPQQARVEAWRDTHRLAEAKPKLDATLAESRRLLMDLDRTSFSSDDPSSVMQAIQRLAGQHRVQVKQVSAEGERAGQDKTIAGYTTIPIKLQVSGRFSTLAQWMSAVESQAGLQIDSWTMTQGKESNEPHQLTVDLTAFLRGTS